MEDCQGRESTRLRIIYICAQAQGEVNFHVGCSFSDAESGQSLVQKSSS